MSILIFKDNQRKLIKVKEALKRRREEVATSIKPKEGSTSGDRKLGGK